MIEPQLAVALVVLGAFVLALITASVFIATTRAKLEARAAQLERERLKRIHAGAQRPYLVLGGRASGSSAREAEKRRLQ